MSSDGQLLRHAALPTPVLVRALPIGPDENPPQGDPTNAPITFNMTNAKSENMLQTPNLKDDVLHPRSLIVAALSALCIIFSGYWHRAEVQMLVSMLRISYAQWSGA